VDNISERIEYLLEKYKENTITRDEFEELMALIQQPGFERILDSVLRAEFSSVQAEWQGLSEPAAERPVRSGFNWGRLMTVAAAVLLVLTTVSYIYFPSEKSVKLAYTTSYGETKTVLLPDSTEVMLNANSRVVWDDNWQQQHKRYVTMEGEAFFKVKNLNGMRFVVEAGDVHVNVIGTEFNVSNRRGVTNVFLESGKVDLEMEDPAIKTLSMQPGNAVMYQKEGAGLIFEGSTTLEANASWVNGMLQFENETLEEVLEKLEELYGKKFEVENKELLTRRMDISLPYGNWELISNAIGLVMNVELIQNENEILIK